MERSGMAKVAAVAVPMVLIECHSSPPQAPKERVTVVDIGSAGPARASDETGADSTGASASRAKAPSQLRTELNVDIYENCLLIARLSVINPDGSLNRIVLDPKVDFAFVSARSVEGELVCSQAWECDISPVLRAVSQQVQPASISAAFKPGQDSGLSASSAMIPLAGEDFHQNCP